jgi:hypothetical protein
MPRSVTTIILSATGTPREGLRVDFHASDPAQSVHAVTDAGGVFVAEVEAGVEYLIPSSNAFSVNGQDFPSGTTFRLIVPVGEGPISLTNETVEIIDLSPPTLMREIATLKTRVAALEIIP